MYGPTRFFKRFRCRVYLGACFMWISISFLFTLLRTDKPHTLIPVTPTTITERLKFVAELTAYINAIKVKANTTNKLYDGNVSQFLQRLTDIPNYPYNQTGCTFVCSTRRASHKTSLITQRTCPDNYTLLILVSSNISHFDRRSLIRHTWGGAANTDSQYKSKVYFLVGRTADITHLRKLSCEAEMFEDIIFGDTYEDFYNLTFKVQMGFEWSVNYCNFEYLLKADDDVFVNLQRVFVFLYDKETPRTQLYAGNVHYAATVFRSGKYAVSKKEYWKNIYPRYCSGGGYILSSDVVKLMTSHFDSVYPLKIDDAYVGELALSCGIDVVHHDSFKMFESEEECSYNSSFIVHHPVKNRACMLKLYAKNSLLLHSRNGVR